ncbi:MAG: phosphatidylglycerol---prolipoprotein diacylglyceryl transferase [Chloroflexota bacterium]|nr:phosphatidylglycerol---prolipoprotein diacylglyceryl transferase [Chloroflexota bacterium]
MLPTIEIGSLRLNTYWLLQSLAIVIAGALAYRRLLRGGITSRAALTGLLLIFWGGLAGSVLLKSLGAALRDLALTGDFALQLDAGSAFLGALIGGVVVGWLWFRGVGISTGRAFDLWVVPAPMGQAIGRLGCLAAACCHGKPTDSWLGLHLPDHDGFWAARYPTQLLSAAANLLIFMILLRLERALARRPSVYFPGALTVAYLLLYATKRFAIEFLRADTTLRLGGALTMTHVLYAILFLVALVVLVYRVYRTNVPGALQTPGA